MDVTVGGDGAGEDVAERDRLRRLRAAGVLAVGTELDQEEHAEREDAGGGHDADLQLRPRQLDQVGIERAGWHRRTGFALLDRLDHLCNRHPIVQIDNAPPHLVAWKCSSYRVLDGLRWIVVADERPTSSRERPLGVADVVRLAGRAVDALGLVWLEGEVTQVSQPSSGHLYFALHERGSVLAAVMWGRDVQRIRVPIQAGQRIR